MTTWRFLDTGALPGAVNMAIDEAILTLHLRGQSPPTLRLYRWNPPALSLGRLQRRHGFDLDACRRRGFDVVPRPSGGKAVLHLGDLTYAVIAGVADGIPAMVRTAYTLICQGLLAAFRLMEMEAALGAEARPSAGSDLCFLHAGAGAIVLGNRKFVGSAQAWRGSSMLQHGAILLEPQIEALLDVQSAAGVDQSRARDELKARMTSLREILGFVPEHEALAQAIRMGMGRVLKAFFVEGGLSPEELSLAQQITGQEIPLQKAVAGQPFAAEHVGDRHCPGHPEDGRLRFAGRRDGHGHRHDFRGIGLSL
jgi:lipoate-protein ligase A